MRRLTMVLVLALILAGCGGSKELTNEQVEAMGEQDALTMLNCQLQKASNVLGEEAAGDRYVDEWMNSAEQNGDMLQVILARDGYECPEYLS
jgi:PBP1b-binding outer membrane lipoprotein LpoB